MLIIILEVQIQHETQDSICVNIMNTWNAFLAQHPETPNTSVELQKLALIKLGALCVFLIK